MECNFGLILSCVLVRFWNGTYDFRPNCTPPNSIAFTYFILVIRTKHPDLGALPMNFLTCYVFPLQDDPKNEEERPDSKSKVKRGLFGRSTKRKSGSRPSSGVIACEMIMSEEDRINLLKSVKNQELTVDQALKRFLRWKVKIIEVISTSWYLFFFLFFSSSSS